MMDVEYGCVDKFAERILAKCSLLEWPLVGREDPRC